jgi:RNA polymerase sigma-70 factor (ECF subfamily)
MRSDIEEAVALIKRGDESALEKALGLLQQAVFSFGMRVCGQREDAEDTMQEVLVKVIPYLPKFDNSKALAKWLYTVAKNRCLMSRRKSKFAPKQELSLEELMPDRQELEMLDHPSGATTPESATIRHEQDRHLREAIRTLPPHYRIVLVLRDMEGFTDEEVGEITGLRPGTVRIRRRELGKAHKASSAAGRGGSVVSRTARCRKMFAGLSDYLDGELDDFSCEEIEQHLNGCEPCKKFLRSLESAIRSCQSSAVDCPDRQRAVVLRKQLLVTYSRALASAEK